MPPPPSNTSSNHPPSSPPNYDLATVESLPSYPTPDDPSPPEYFEIIRFNASSYSWTATNAQLQAAINAGGISPTTTTSTRNNEARSVTTAAIFYLPEEQSAEAITRDEEAERRESEVELEAQRQNREERAEVVRQHWRPLPRTGNSIRGLSSILERWGDLAEAANERSHAVSTLKRESTLELRTVDLPGWMKARIEERQSKSCGKWVLSRLLNIRRRKSYSAF